eukprot:scaffold34662_cov64-Phaeocystis_antarctica.AAC.1
MDGWAQVSNADHVMFAHVPLAPAFACGWRVVRVAGISLTTACASTGAEDCSVIFHICGTKLSG